MCIYVYNVFLARDNIRFLIYKMRIIARAEEAVTKRVRFNIPAIIQPQRIDTFEKPSYGDAVGHF